MVKGTSTTNEMLAEFARYVCFPGCVVVGKVGLDWSYLPAPGKHDQQSKVFQLLIQVALDADKPLVLHLWDGPFCSSSSVLDQAFLMLTHTVPHNIPMYLHCFTGSAEEAWQWLDCFH